MLAVAALVGATMGIGQSSAMPQTSYELKPSPDAMNWLRPMPRCHGIQTGRVGGNQRQQRKDRRRANAAGKRNAFT